MKNFLYVLALLFVFSSCGFDNRVKQAVSADAKVVAMMDTITVVIEGRIVNVIDNSKLNNGEVNLISNKNSYTERSDVKGEFTFGHIQSGKYLVIGRHIDFYDLKDSIQINSGEIIDLKLKLAHNNK